MKNRRYVFILTLGFVGGLVCGMFSAQIFSEHYASAGKTDETMKAVRTERFELVDAKGNTYVELNVSKRGPQLRMFDRKGSAIDLFIDQPGGEPRAGLFFISPKGHSIKLELTDTDTHIRLADEKGRVIWSMP